MIQFNELRITPDAQYLILEVQVKSDSYFNNIGIENIQILKIDNIEGEDTLLLTDNPEDDDSLAIEKEALINTGIKRVRYKLTSSNLNNTSLRGSLFKIVVQTKGEASFPEGYASPIVSVLISDLYPFYIKTLANIRMLDDLNSNSDELIDCILRFKALELAFRTGNTNLAIQYWFKYFSALDEKCGRSFLKVNYYD